MRESNLAISRSPRRRRDLRVRHLALCVVGGLGCLGAGCDRLMVSDFRGARVLLTISGPSDVLRSPPDEHLELWARDGDKVVRLLSGRASASDATAGCNGDECLNKNGYARSLYALAILPSVDFTQACMIDKQGRLAWADDAQLYPDEEEARQSPADRANRARAVKDRIRVANGILAVVSYGEQAKDDLDGEPCMRCANNMLYACLGVCRLRRNLLLESERTACGKDSACPDGYLCSPDENGAPLCFATPERRKNECDSRDSRTNRHFYAGNPMQLTAPPYGIFAGTVDYASTSQVIGGFQVVSNYQLQDLRELWITQTRARVDAVDVNEVDCRAKPASCRGRVILSGVAGQDERGVYHIDLTSTLPDVAGHASVVTRLDQDPVQF